MSAILREMPLFVFLFFTALACGAGGICLFAASRARRQVRAIQSTTTSPIGMADNGYRKFEGYCEPVDGELLAAPLTGSPCVWFSARIEKWASPASNEGGGSWATVKEFSTAAPFLLRDATGVLAVHPWQAEVTPSDKSQWYGSKLMPTNRNPPRIDPLDSAQPIVEGSSKYRYFEERIYADAPLLVVGEFINRRFSGDADDAEEQAAPDPGVSAEDRIEANAYSATTASVRKGGGRRPFIISTKLQAVHVATAEMGSQAAMAMAAAFGLLAALMLYARYS